MSLASLQYKRRHNYCLSYEQHPTPRIYIYMFIQFFKYSIVTATRIISTSCPPKSLIDPCATRSVDFDRSVYLAVEPKARHVADCARQQEEGERNNAHVSEVQEHRDDTGHLQLG